MIGLDRKNLRNPLDFNKLKIVHSKKHTKYLYTKNFSLTYIKIEDNFYDILVVPEELFNTSSKLTVLCSYLYRPKYRV